MTLCSSCDEIAEIFQLPELPPLEPRYNIAPTQETLVVRRLPESTSREAARLRWGLIPSWAKDSAIGSRLINARSESAAEKPAFRRAFRQRRCLVPTDGFYEWQHGGARRQPFLIRLLKPKPFALGGLWETWTNPAGETLETFTILTTAANDVVRPLHDRMPVILDPRSFDLWLDPALRDPERLKPLLRPFPADALVAVPVSPMVNDPHNEGAQCLEPPAHAQAPPPPPRSRRKASERDKGQQLLF